MTPVATRVFTASETADCRWQTAKEEARDAGDRRRRPERDGHRARRYRYWIGGTLFGVGWALLSVCLGPLFAVLGSGVSVMLVALLSALAGTWTYSYLRP